jgi:hypothetical protein
VHFAANAIAANAIAANEIAANEIATNAINACHEDPITNLVTNKPGDKKKRLLKIL